MTYIYIYVDISIFYTNVLMFFSIKTSTYNSSKITNYNTINLGKGEGNEEKRKSEGKNRER